MANEFIGYEYNSDLNDLEWIGEELACKYTPDTFIQKLLNEKFSANKTFKEKLDESILRFAINTERLCRVPATVKLCLLELYDCPVFASALKVHVPKEWSPDQITPEVIEEFFEGMKV